MLANAIFLFLITLGIFCLRGFIVGLVFIIIAFAIKAVA